MLFLSHFVVPYSLCIEANAPSFIAVEAHSGLFCDSFYYIFLLNKTEGAEIYLLLIPHSTNLFLTTVLLLGCLLEPSSYSPLKLKVQKLESHVFQAKGVGMHSVLQRPRYYITGFLIAVIQLVQ